MDKIQRAEGYRGEVRERVAAFAVCADHQGGRDAEQIMNAFSVVKDAGKNTPNSVQNTAVAARRLGTIGTSVIGYESGNKPLPNSIAAAAAKQKAQIIDWKVPILISYAYWDKNTASALKKWEGQYRLYLDSGAFTAYKQKREINFDEFCAFVKSPPVHIDRYFMLDKIGDPMVTKRNLDKMLQRGLKPIPIFTRGDEEKRVDELYQISNLIGIGGLTGSGGASTLKYFELHLRKNRPIHWLGFAQRDFVLYFKPTSFDSTIWVNGCRFGYIQIFHDNSWRKIERPDIIAGRYRREIESLGFDYNELKREENWHRVDRESYIGKITAVSWLKWARRLELGSGTTTAMHPDLDMKNVSKAYAVVKSQDPEPNSIKNTAAAQRLKSLDKRESDARSGRVCRSGSGNDNQGTKAFTASAGSLSGNANPDYIMKRRERI